MKILHTSDWHLGCSLYGKKRYDEFQAFLNWLIQIIKSQQIDIVLICGDIFDTCYPGHQAQKLYYQFFHQLPPNLQVVIIAGNHDSPSFLNAPKALLETLNIFVIGEITSPIEDEVIVLKNIHQEPQLIVCAVPYLRDKDVRVMRPGENIQNRNIQLLKGIKEHYAKVCSDAKRLQIEIQQKMHLNIPIVAMGHLFTKGATTIEGDGVRELYIGTLSHVSSDIFPDYLDYVALGHIHTPQMVEQKSHIRYSGSPLPIGFGESQQNKEIIIIEFNLGKIQIKPITIPKFQALYQIKGSIKEILNKIEELKKSHHNIWLEIEYLGNDRIPNLRQLIEDAVEKSHLEVLRIKNKLIYNQTLHALSKNKTLEDLTPDDVFQHCLRFNNISNEQQKILTTAYHEIIQTLQEKERQF